MTQLCQAFLIKCLIPYYFYITFIFQIMQQYTQWTILTTLWRNTWTRTTIVEQQWVWPGAVCLSIPRVMEQLQEAQLWTLQLCCRSQVSSKTITAVAILRLVQDGHLHLADKVFGPDGILSSLSPYPITRCG